MTGPATDGDVRVFDSIEKLGPEDGETGRARSACAREDDSKVEVTDGYGKLKAWIGARRAALARWWVWTEQPLSYSEAWRQSAFNAARVPSGAPWWVPWLWRMSNCTDRPLWFAFMLTVPAGLQLPMRWAAVRPTRRLGAYLLLALLVTVFATVKVG